MDGQEIMLEQDDVEVIQVTAELKRKQSSVLNSTALGFIREVKEANKAGNVLAQSIDYYVNLLNNKPEKAIMISDTIALINDCIYIEKLSNNQFKIYA